VSKRQCLVCDSGMAPAPNLPGLLVCHACTFVSADLDLSADELRALYGADYFHGAEYSDYLADRAVAEKQFRIRLRQVLAYVPERRRSSLFEIGCAYGFFLAVAREEFRDVSGVDISEPAVAWARENLGVRATACDFNDYVIENSPDAVCMWDTVEHLARPDLYLQKLAGVMKTGSVLAVTTGDIGSVVARVRGRKWRQIHPPTHLHYFSKKSMARLLEQHGYDVTYSGSDGMYRSLDTMASIMFRQKRRLPWLYDALKATGVLKYDLYLNLHDILFMIARKR
jgi:SAM-dependent methyltransferase